MSTREQLFSELSHWYEENRRESRRLAKLMRMLDEDSTAVWDIAMRLYKDGWDDDIDVLVHVSRLLAGDDE